MALDIKTEVERLRSQYAADPRSETYNSIIYGDMGTGKTHTLLTAPLPLFVHSFDPGGTNTIEDQSLIDKGLLIIDKTFEREDPRKPFAFDAWEKEFDKLEREGFFKHIGTYAIDSATTWAEAIMNAVLKRAGRTGGFPQQNDYGPQMNTIKIAMQRFTALPCHCILTAHVDTDKDEASGRMFAYPALTGKLKRRIPILFDEVYAAQAKSTSKGTEFSLLTQPDGMYNCRTRLGKDGKFAKFEEPNIKNLLKKAGKPFADKPGLL